MAQLTRVLVIGAGSIGERHARCFLATQRTEVAICELDAEKCQAVSSRYPLVGAYNDLETALEHHAFDAAVVAVPAHLHIEVATRLARSGIHLLIEKPLSTSLQGLRELEALVRERGLTVAVAYILRSIELIESLREAVLSGRFGQPIEVVSVSGQNFPTYRPAYREIYYTRHEHGGGAIQDALTHHVNAVEWLVGPITRVTADAAHKVLDGVEVEDVVHAIARHQSGVMSSFALNQFQAPNESTITVNCEHGTVRLESHRQRWLSITEPGGEWNVEATASAERDDGFIRQANVFLDALEGKGDVRCTLAEGLQTLRVNLAMLESRQTAQWVAIEP